MFIHINALSPRFLLTLYCEWKLHRLVYNTGAFND